jgi:hypothetical protein
MSIPLASVSEASPQQENMIPQPYRYERSDQEIKCRECGDTLLDERIPGTLCLYCALKDRHSRGQSRQFFCDDCGAPVPIITASLDFQIQPNPHRTYVDWTDTHTIGDAHSDGRVILRCRENCNGTHCQKCQNTFDQCQCTATIHFYTDARPGRYLVEDTVIRKTGKPTLNQIYKRRYAVDFLNLSSKYMSNFSYADVIYGDTYIRPKSWKNNHCLNLIDP